MNKGAENLRNRVKFTKDTQPSGAAKSAGWKKKTKGVELAKAVLNLAFKGAKDSELKKLAAEYFAIPEDKITVEVMLLFRQAEKAIQKADTAAFKAVMERAHGLPSSSIDITTKGKAIQRPVVVVSDQETKEALGKLRKG